MAESTKSKKPRRRLRAAAPETVRQRATQSETNRPRKLAKVKGAGARLKPLRVILKPFKFVGRYIIPPYLKNSWKELRLVTWPNGKQTRQLTAAVIIFSVVFGGIVAIFDYGLDKLFKEVILK